MLKNGKPKQRFKLTDEGEIIDSIENKAAMSLVEYAEFSARNGGIKRYCQQLGMLGVTAGTELASLASALAITATLPIWILPHLAVMRSRYRKSLK